MPWWGKNYRRMNDGELQQAMSDASEDYANAGMEARAAQDRGDEGAARRWRKRAIDARNATTEIAREMQRRGPGS